MFGPNIIGHGMMDTNANEENPLVFLADGAFEVAVKEKSGTYASYLSYRAIPKFGELTMDASRSNSIFGKADSVQPNSICLLPCMKA